jgi:outer membrane lipoprotein SlyB
LIFCKLVGNSSTLAIIGRLAKVFVWRGTAKFRGYAILMAFSLAVSGCGAQGLMPGSSREPLTPAQQELVDENKRFAQTIGEGAVVGALVGAALGLAFGGNNRATAAAIGAGAGGALGAAAGYAVARKNYEQSQTEDNLRKAIGEARADTDAYARSAQASHQIAVDARGRVDALNAQYRTKTITAAEYRSKMASFNDSGAIMHKQIAQMQTEAADLRADAERSQSQDRQDLIASANQIDTSRKNMERNVQSLEAALSEVPAG